MGHNKDISKSEIVVYKSDDKSVEFQVLLDENEDAVWANQQQIIELFGKSRGTIIEHIQNIYAESELNEIATCRKFRQVQKTICY